MIPEIILFIILAVIAVASALGMLLSRSAIYSALNLIINFCTVAVLYLLLNAPFISLVQITVYAGAIMVLFLFVIMLLGTERLRYSSTLAWQQPVAIILAVILLLMAAYIIFIHPEQLSAATTPDVTFGSPDAVGQSLFSKYLLPFEIVSVLLLVAIIGAIVLTRRRDTESIS
jgi:NADH-quinone oxidoreductase subunit J